ncbi:hypothetical protein DFQ26_001102, partial [Actinomortierella ambigua]
MSTYRSWLCASRLVLTRLCQRRWGTRPTHGPHGAPLGRHPRPPRDKAHTRATPGSLRGCHPRPSGKPESWGQGPHTAHPQLFSGRHSRPPVLVGELGTRPTHGPPPALPGAATRGCQVRSQVMVTVLGSKAWCRGTAPCD